MLHPVNWILQNIVIGLISEWKKDGKLIKGTVKNLGGTMRLGSYEARLKRHKDKQNIQIFKNKKDIVIDMKLTLIIKKNLVKV